MKTKRRQDRRGIAAVEAVVCMPLFVLLAYSAIAVSQAITLRHKLVVICNAAAQASMDDNTTLAQAIAQAQELADSAGLKAVSFRVVTHRVRESSNGQPYRFNEIRTNAVIRQNLPLFLPLPRSLAKITVHSFALDVDHLNTEKQ